LTAALGLVCPFSPRATDWSAQLRTPLRADCEREQMQQKPLLDNLVGAGQQGGGDIDAERTSRLQVNDELEFGRL